MARTLANLEILDHNIGALSGMTYGTAAIIFKTSTLTGSHTYLGMHTSGGTGGLQLNVDSQTLGYWNGGNYRQTGNVITSTSVWYLVVVRKATGSQIPRASIYDFTADTWTHTAVGTAISDSTASGAGGFAEFRYEASEYWQGDVAIRAAWSNTLPWAADTAGDALIEAQGLQYTLQAWHASSPSALWLYDQADVAQSVPDMAGGGATQSSISGTTVASGSVPTFGYGADLFEVLSAPAGGTNASAESPAGTGTANNPTRAVSTGSQSSAGTGTANSPSPGISGSPSNAPATGTANTTTSKVSPSPTLAAGTGTANNATISTGSSTNASAGVASGSGTANSSTSTVAPVAGNATGTGAASSATGSVSASPSIAAASGVSGDATGKVSPTPGSASASGTANAPTVQTGSFTNASAGSAAATGTAQQPTGKVSPSPSLATGSGAASNASAGSAVTAAAGLASASGTVNNPAVTRSTSAQAGVALASGGVTAAHLSVLASAEAALALAVALTPTAGAFLAGTAKAAVGAAPSARTATGTGSRSAAASMTVPTATGG